MDNLSRAFDEVMRMAKASIAEHNMAINFREGTKANQQHISAADIYENAFEISAKMFGEVLKDVEKTLDNYYTAK